MSELLQVIVHEATGLSGGFLGKKDPYVKMKVGSAQFHTTAAMNAGKNPKWEQIFAVPYQGETRMEFTVMDKDRAGLDDFMGNGMLDLSSVRATKIYSTNVPINKNGKAAGTVRVTVSLKSNIAGAVGMPPPAPGYASAFPQQGFPPQMPTYPQAQGSYPPTQGLQYASPPPAVYLTGGYAWAGMPLHAGKNPAQDLYSQCPPQMQPQYPLQMQSQYPPQTQPQYPPQTQPQYQPQTQPQYPPQTQPQYPPRY